MITKGDHPVAYAGRWVEYTLRWKRHGNKKLACVVLVPKKGDLTGVSNFRPVSNLCSVSKIYERCLLAQLETLPDFEIARLQHARELRLDVAGCVDEGKHCILYSLDS